MPEVSRFYGIVVKIFYDDHNPPHFHAEYGEHEALVNINTLAILGGSLPARASGSWRNGRHCISRNCGRLGTEPNSFSHREESSLCLERARPARRVRFGYPKAVRGKYYRRLLKEGANVVVLDPDVAKAFRSSAGGERGAAFPPPDVRGYAASNFTFQWSGGKRPPLSVRAEAG
jgi:Domain of unknown function (DUF4160)